MKVDYQICTRCIMDTTDPEISFNEEGVCNHCIKFDTLIKPRWYPGSEGKIKFDGMVKNIIKEGEGQEYDCVIGLSGGIDSSYLAYFLRTNYPQLRLLAIHIDAGWNSELAVHNIEQIVKKLNIDLHTEVINWKEMKDLQVSYLKSQLANQDVPQDHAFFSTLYRIAVEKFQIRYFLSGFNFATESILPSSWGYSAMDAKQLRAVHKQYGTVPLKEYKTVGFFKKYIYYPYIKKFQIISPLNYFPYNKEEAKKIIMDNLNWKDYGGKHHESRFTKFFQSYWLPQKFGYDKRRAHLSSLIVSGQLSREAAIEEMKQDVYTEDTLREDMEFLAKKLGFSVEEFTRIMNMPNKTFYDYPSEHRVVQALVRILSIIKKINLK